MGAPTFCTFISANVLEGCVNTNQDRGMQVRCTQSVIFWAQSPQAEELMRKIEKEEEQISYDDPDKKVFHLCIVNLVIG